MRLQNVDLNFWVTTRRASKDYTQNQEAPSLSQINMNPERGPFPTDRTLYRTLFAAFMLVLGTHTPNPAKNLYYVSSGM